MFAAETPSASGRPFRSVRTWILLPALPRSTGFGPVSDPLFRAQARPVDDRPGPVDLPGGAEVVEDRPMEFRPQARLGPFGEAPVRGLVRDAEDRRQVPPGAAGGQDEYDRREHLAVIGPRDTTALRAFRRGPGSVAR
jgi:hypothetical protein